MKRKRGKNLSPGATLSSIEERDPATYQTLIQSMEQTEFQAPTGRFSFYNNTGDARYVYHVLIQSAMPGCAQKCLP